MISAPKSTFPAIATGVGEGEAVGKGFGSGVGEVAETEAEAEASAAMSPGSGVSFRPGMRLQAGASSIVPASIAEASTAAASLAPSAGWGDFAGASKGLERRR